MKLRTIGLLTLITSLWGFAPPDRNPNLKQNMIKLYEDLASILPAYLNPYTFFNEKNKDRVAKHLTSIHDHAVQVQKILQNSDEEQKILSKSLEHMSKMAAKSYEKGAQQTTAFFIGDMLDTCLSCHTSRMANKDSAFNIAKNVNLQALDPYGRAKLLTISRQFDKAMKEYERILTQKSLLLSDIVHFDPFLNYLVLGIRVKTDYKRVEKTLRTTLKRALPKSVKTDVNTWINSLSDIQNNKWNKGSRIQQAQKLMDYGKHLMEYPRDQSGAIYFLEASRRLKEVLHEKNISSKSKAIAYLLLGKSEITLGRPFLGLEARQYFESSIRLSPKSKVAQEAFELYEEHLTFGYTGSSGVHLPKEELEKLKELRQRAF